MRIKVLLVAAGLAAGSLAALPISATAGTSPAGPPVYLALGDSLSVGYQPLPAPGGDTNQGYSDDLFATLHAANPALTFKKLGCSGETTATMINGGKCSYAGFGSQLAAAVDFIAHNNVRYLTLDIGANDVDGCTPNGSIDAACLLTGVTTITQNLNTILFRLHTADGGKPSAVGMTYYDPFLEYWLNGTQGQAVATASVGLLTAINTAEVAAYSQYGFGVADVFSAFNTLDFLPNLPSLQPVNVTTICNLTYECTVQNIHANPAGYQLIANTFAKVIH